MIKKFKVWDKVNNIMYTHDSCGDVRLHLDGKVDVDGIPATDDVIVLQYAGIKDSKGTEIYEGDIIFGHYILEWGAGQYMLKDILIPNAELKMLGGFYFHVDNCIVHGNIYEDVDDIEEVLAHNASNRLPLL